MPSRNPLGIRHGTFQILLELRFYERPTAPWLVSGDLSGAGSLSDRARMKLQEICGFLKVKRLHSDAPAGLLRPALAYFHVFLFYPLRV